MIHPFKILGWLLGLGLLHQTAVAQSLATGSAADQYLRFLQVSGQLGDSLGMANRPYLLPGSARNATDSALFSLVRTPLFRSFGKKINAGVLPLQLTQQWVGATPQYRNDGAMIPAKGYQVLASAGVYGRVGPLSIQLAPEFVYASNSTYATTPLFGEVPRRNFRQVLPGQSAIRLQGGPVGLAVATENLWWGPGIHHSLLMSDQAPGFLHARFYSARPLKTPIGNFEWTLIGGKLQSNKDFPFDNANQKWGDPANIASDRYLNAYVLVYQPRFLPGFSIGVNRVLQTYISDMEASNESALSRFLPILFKPIQKDNAVGEDTKRADQLASAFFRWVLPKSKAEFYGELGFNDYKANNRDLVLNLPHSAAYLAGVRKVVAAGGNRFWDAGFEWRKTSQSPDALVRDAGNWYFHGSIFEGYTHRNQVMGSPYGSNSLTFSVARQQGLARTGLQLQQYQFNYIVALPQSSLWTDYVLSLNHAQPLRGFFLDGQLQAIRSGNYGFAPNNNKFQVMAKVGVRYYFHD